MTRSPASDQVFSPINRCAMLFYKTKPRDSDLSLPHTKTSGADIGTGDGETEAVRSGASCIEVSRFYGFSRGEYPLRSPDRTERPADSVEK